MVSATFEIKYQIFKLMPIRNRKKIYITKAVGID